MGDSFCLATDCRRLPCIIALAAPAKYLIFYFWLLHLLLLVVSHHLVEARFPARLLLVPLILESIFKAVLARSKSIKIS